MSTARPDTPATDPDHAGHEPRPANATAPLQPFEVFRPAGTDRLAGQRFPGQGPLARTQRDGPVGQRKLADAEAPDVAAGMQAAALRSGVAATLPAADEAPGRRPAAAVADEHTPPSPTLLRVQTLQLNMQQRIAALRAEQADAFERLRAWEDDGREQTERLAQHKSDTSGS